MQEETIYAKSSKVLSTGITIQDIGNRYHGKYATYCDMSSKGIEVGNEINKLDNEEIKVRLYNHFNNDYKVEKHDPIGILTVVKNSDNFVWLKKRKDRG